MDAGNGVRLARRQRARDRLHGPRLTDGNRCANTPAATVTDTNGQSNGGTVNVPGACPAGTYPAIPADTRDGFWNNASIVKLQYQHNMGSSAYIRFYGYTFYSDWLQNGPLSYGTDLFGLGVLSYDYELESHTRGLAFSFADQLSSTNQIHARRELYYGLDQSLQ